MAVFALFFTNGALLGNLVPRYPEIKSAFSLSDSAYGLTIAAMPTGSILAGLAAGMAIRRFTSARVAVYGTTVIALGVFGVSLAPSALVVAAILFLCGATDALVDVAQNTHGLRVQKRYGRSIINAFHAAWSVGAVAGGSMAAGAIALDLSLSTHLLISGSLFTLVALVSLRWCLPGADEEHLNPAEVLPSDTTAPHAAPAEPGIEGEPSAQLAPQEGDVNQSTNPGEIAGQASLARNGTMMLLLALGAIAFASSLIEDTGASWATVFLTREIGAPQQIAAFGYVALVGAQFIGRAIGDRMVDALGQRHVAQMGGTLVIIGMSLALVHPTIATVILGFAAAGFGIATLIPAVMTSAENIPGLKFGTGVTVVSWMMRVAFLSAPPLIGLIADATELRIGLILVPLAGLVVVIFSPALGTSRRRRRHNEG